MLNLYWATEALIFLLNAPIQDKIISQKKHQCLHSMQERRVHIECIDARQDYKPEEAPMIAFNVGMRGSY
jgi:hypothetical protein